MAKVELNSTLILILSFVCCGLIMAGAIYGIWKCYINHRRDPRYRVRPHLIRLRDVVQSRPPPGLQQPSHAPFLPVFRMASNLPQVVASATNDNTNAVLSHRRDSGQVIFVRPPSLSSVDVSVSHRLRV